MGSLVNNVVKISTSLETDFYKLWFDFLQPLHKLTEKERAVMAAYVKKHCELRSKVSDDDLIAQFLKTDDIRRMICADCGIKIPHLNVILTKFKQSGIIVDGRIHPKYIPNVSPGSKSFGLLVLFDLRNKDGGTENESSRDSKKDSEEAKS